jgi:hypothetical protein
VTTILCLGVSYVDLLTHKRAEEASKEAEGRVLMMEDEVGAIQQGLLTQMDGRDLAQCLTVEVCGGEQDEAIAGVPNAEGKGGNIERHPSRRKKARSRV